MTFMEGVGRAPLLLLPLTDDEKEEAVSTVDDAPAFVVTMGGTFILFSSFDETRERGIVNEDGKVNVSGTNVPAALMTLIGSSSAPAIVGLLGIVVDDVDVVVEKRDTIKDAIS